MDFVFVTDFFEKLDFDLDVIYENYDKENGESIYKINDEAVYLETKNEVRPQNINQFIKLRSENLPLMIASKYITPKAKAILKEKNINYIDDFGNAFINLKNLKVYIERGNAKPYVSDSSAIFTQSGGQILFQFLKNSENINETYRYLAHASDVSLGSVSKFMQALFEEGYAVNLNDKKKYLLIKKEELLNRWVNVLNEKILPSYKLGNFTFSQHNRADWKNKLMYPNVQWGGEPAASLITKYLNPEKFSLFTKLSKPEIIKDLKLLPKEQGEIIIYKPFWVENNEMEKTINYANRQNVVHPLIIYAQLGHSGNNRNLETAQILFNEHIQPYL